MRWESHQRHAIWDRMGQGLPATMLGTVPMTNTHAALCCLTPPAPRTAWCGESSPGPYSLGINIQDQLFPPSLGYPLLGPYSLGTHARRAPHDGPASASTGPRHDARRMRHTLRQAVGAPTSCTGLSSCVLGVSTPVPSHQPDLGTPHRSNIQRPARLQQMKVRLPSQELPHRIRPGVIGASLQSTKDRTAPSTISPQ